MLLYGAQPMESCVGAFEEVLPQHTQTHREASEKMKRIVAIAVMVMALVALPSAALASGSSTCSSYNPQLCQIVDNGNAGTPSSGPADAPVAVQSSGSLPFTGLDLGLVAVGGVSPDRVRFGSSQVVSITLIAAHA